MYILVNLLVDLSVQFHKKIVTEDSVYCTLWTHLVNQNSVIMIIYLDWE
jgi:hypothetical protein